MEYKDVKPGMIFDADWSGLLIYIINTSDTNIEFALFEANKNKFSIYIGDKAEWDDSLWLTRDPKENTQKYRIRFIGHIFDEEVDI